MKSDQLRQKFIEFFVQRGHRHVPSSPLVPPDDPTLLFTTAGMVQFKRLYSGSVELPYRRACSAQKCLRAGGKGSDLENVGRTLRHHTFFEMLGNFSFGDYFKREAIQWAWEFSTGVAGLDPARICASVYEDDDEAWDIWTKEIGLPESRMVRLGVKDNFWGPAGDTGACGPCSELYYDRGEQYGPALDFRHATVNDDDPGTRYLEFWNCVFPQFDQQKDGSRPPLKNSGVDTGMSLERLTCLVQNRASLFETDLFRPIIECVCALTGVKSYDDAPIETKQCVNVAADHARSLVFALSEGILPGNEGRGYVLRRLLRRSARYARRIGQEAPFLHNVVDAVTKVMGDAYPEIREITELVKKVMRLEEEAYAETLGAGLQKLEGVLEKSKPKGVKKPAVISGADAFMLVSTYGLPIDDIREIALDRGYTLNEAEYQTHAERHRDESRKVAVEARFAGMEEALREIYEAHGPTFFTGHSDSVAEMLAEMEDAADKAGCSLEELVADLMDQKPDASNTSCIVDMTRRDSGESSATDDDDYDDTLEGKEDVEEADDDGDLLGGVSPAETVKGVETLAVFMGGKQVQSARAGDEVAVVLSDTPFYAEGGGQAADTGDIESEGLLVRITDTQKTNEEVFVHFGIVERGVLSAGDLVDARIDFERRLAIMRNHTATHLLQGALKRVAGKHVTQHGSYVGPDHLRFDFSNPVALTMDQIAEVERLVNERILEDLELIIRTMPLEEAREIPGIIAPFGEKYDARVRVVNVPDWDVEFCGGTHMRRTGGIGAFVILSESAIASGVRRIEAATGAGAMDAIQRERAALKSLSESLSVPREQVVERVQALQQELKAARKQIAQLRAKLSSADAAQIIESAPVMGGVRFVSASFEGLAAQELRGVYDALKSRQPRGLAAVLASSAEGRATIMAAVTPDVAAKGLSASDIVKKIAPIVGGSGGGKPEMAQAGGKNPENIGDALKAAREHASSILHSEE
ncbi:MAG: alanine--tRNA ligase [bacterium]